MKRVHIKLLICWTRGNGFLTTANLARLTRFSLVSTANPCALVLEFVLEEWHSFIISRLIGALPTSNQIHVPFPTSRFALAAREVGVLSSAHKLTLTFLNS